MHGPANAAALVAALTLLSCAQDARADVLPQNSGNALMRECQGDGADRSYCVGRLRGLDDMNDMMAELGKTSRFWCIPNGVTGDQMRRVVVNYMAANPQSLHRHANVLVAVAFAEAFPCKAPATTGSVPRQY